MPYQQILDLLPTNALAYRFELVNKVPKDFIAPGPNLKSAKWPSMFVVQGFRKAGPV
jgi:hypothetical protein